MLNEMSRTKKAIINAFFSIASQLLSIVLSFVLRTAFIKILGDQYTGVSTVFTTILAMLSLSELGFATAIATALYKPLREKNNELICQLMSLYKKVYRLVALTVFVIGMILIPFLRYLVKDVPDIKENITVIYILYIFKTSISYLMIYKTTILNADQRIYVVKKLEMFCQVIRYLVEILALIIFKEFFVYLCIEVIATVIQNYILTKKAENEYPNAFSLNAPPLPHDTVKSLLKDVKGLSMFKLSGTIGNSIDTMLISSFINTATVTIVGNYTMIKDQVYKLLMQFFSAVIPSIGNLAAEGDANKQEKIFNRIFYISFLMVNFCASSLFVLFEPFMKIWLGEKYVLSNSIAFVIAFDFFLYILLEAIASFRTANGLFVEGQYRPVATALVNVILSIIFIQKFGVFGTILATIIARFTTQWYDPYLLYKMAFKKKFKSFYLKYLCYVFLFISGCMITKISYGVLKIENRIISLIVGMVVCLIIPTTWVLLFTWFTDEFTYVKDMLKNFTRKAKE